MEITIRMTVTNPLWLDFLKSQSRVRFKRVDGDGLMDLSTDVNQLETLDLLCPEGIGRRIVDRFMYHQNPESLAFHPEYKRVMDGDSALIGVR